jgi:hypothetical protein
MPDSDDESWIYIGLPARLYDDWLDTKFGAIQGQNRAAPSATVRIDFGYCEFASPLAVLALATELLTHSSEGRLLILDLGAGGIGEVANNKARTRKYLSVHGLLDAFLSRQDLRVRLQFDQNADQGADGYWYSSCVPADDSLENLRICLERAPVDLLYGTSVVLRATTWRLPSGHQGEYTAEVRAKVDALLRDADQALFRFKTEARKVRDTTLHKLTHVLLELVENAAEHAYLGSAQGFVGLYCRVRASAPTAMLGWRNDELRQSPLLSRVLRSDGQHQVEVFVVDVGRGLLADVLKWDGCEAIADSKYPLRSLSGKLFFSPVSRHSRKDKLVAEQRGLSTGLMHLNEILQRENDSSRIIAGVEWVAGTHPRDPNFEGVEGTSGNFHLGAGRLSGTIFHVGITPAEIPRLEAPWFEPNGEGCRTTREAVLYKLGSSDSVGVTDVVDIRYGDRFASIRSEVTTAAAKGDRALVRFGRVAPKNYINDLLSSWCATFAQPKRTTALLYLCDLGRTQAIDAVWIISQYFPRSLSAAPGLRAAVYVVTEDLCCLMIRFRFRRRPGSDIVSASIQTLEVPTSRVPDGLAYVILSLRRHDSKRIWERIRKLDALEETPVLFKNVLWRSSSEPTRILPMYLDFATLVQDREAARYVRRGLRRLLALFPDANDRALDPIVEAPLHDAKKWLDRNAAAVDRREVLVGSLSVSGSTLRRYRRTPGTTIAGVIDCMHTPYFARQTGEVKHHVSALLWDSELPVQTTTVAEYERIGWTAYIRPIVGDRPKPNFDERLYRALEADRLTKLGHWTYGDRHSLIDINAELAIEQSAASGAGALPWLRDQLVELRQLGQVCIVFPFNRLAYRLAHTVHSMLPSPAKEEIRLLALSFLPRHAGGLAAFEPLSAEAARRLARTWTDQRRIAAFLDIGFVTSRTLRHATRQLVDCGFEEVRGLGMLNRSSSPLLDTERATNAPSVIGVVPAGYWRWNLPILGGAAHCAICAALPSLARLRQVVLESHFDLAQHVDQIASDWSARDVSDYWEEYGVEPKALRAADIAEVQTLFDDFGEGSPSTSATLVARAIELLRLTGDTGIPLRAARLVMPGDPESAMELISCALILAGASLDPREREEYAITLIHAVTSVRGDLDPATPSPRWSKLVSLAALAFAMQGVTCRLTALDELAKVLTKTLILEPSVRVALIALTTDADESVRVRDEFSAICTRSGTNATLKANYHALRPDRANVRETWGKLVRVFGRSPSHSQQAVAGQLRAQLHDGRLTPATSIPTVNEVANLLAQCHKEFVSDSLGVDLATVIPGLRSARDIAGLPTSNVIALCDCLTEVLGRLEATVHSTLVRVGHGATHGPNVRMAFYPMLSKIALEHGMSMASDVVATPACCTLQWPQDSSGYLPLCRALERLIKDVFENVNRWGILAPPPHLIELKELAGRPARMWWWIEKMTSSLSEECTLVIMNGLRRENVDRVYTPSLGYLSDSLFTVSQGKYFESDGQWYFQIRIGVPALGRVLQEVT